MIRPTTISQIAYLQPHIFIKFGASFLCSLLLNLLLHCLWIKHLLSQIKLGNLACELLLVLLSTSWNSSFGSLTLLKLLSVEEEFLHLLLLLMNFTQIIIISMWNSNACLLKVYLLLQKLLPLIIWQVLVTESIRPHVWTWNPGSLW